MTITKEHIELVEEYNGSIRCLWMDIFFTNLLKHYFDLLGGETFDVDEISKTSYIENVLTRNEEEKRVLYFIGIKTPVKYIQEAIKKVFSVTPIYEQFKKIGIKPNLISSNDFFVHYFVK